MFGSSIYIYILKSINLSSRFRNVAKMAATYNYTGYIPITKLSQNPWTESILKFSQIADLHALRQPSPKTETVMICNWQNYTLEIFGCALKLFGGTLLHILICLVY